MNEDIIKLENFIHKHTGVEFTFSQKGNVSGIQCTNPEKFNEFINKEVEK